MMVEKQASNPSEKTKIGNKNKNKQKKMCRVARGKMWKEEVWCSIVKVT